MQGYTDAKHEGLYVRKGAITFNSSSATFAVYVAVLRNTSRFDWP